MDIQLSQIDCANCGLSFWITFENDKRLIKSKKTFYCPNGHPQSYQTNEADRLRTVIAQKNEDIMLLHQQLEEKCKKRRGKKK